MLRRPTLLYSILPHSHSIAHAGLPVTSHTTRFTPLTSLMMRVAVAPGSSCRKGGSPSSRRPLQAHSPLRMIGVRPPAGSRPSMSIRSERIIQSMWTMPLAPPRAAMSSGAIRILRCSCIAGEGPSRLELRARQKIESGEVCDHQYGHVDDRDRVGGGQLPRQRRKAELAAVIIVDDDVACPHDIE